MQRLSDKIGHAIAGRRMVEKQLDEVRSALAEAQMEASRARSDLQSAQSERSRFTSDLQTAQSSIKSRFQELAALTKLLEKAERNRSLVVDQRAWLVEAYTMLAKRPWWWALMPSQWGKRREYDRLRRKKLFDADRYLELYPDVAAEGMDPVRHYIMHGMMEGRTLVR